MLEPVYLGYVDLLLLRADKLPEPQRVGSLRRAIEAVELIRQTELQDFLGDRCAVETVQGGGTGQLLPGTGILYPIILADRLELLLVTSSGIVRRSSPVNSSTLRNSALALANALRGGASDYLPMAQQLYRWLLAPLDEVIAAERLHRLVVAPAGTLRLVPMAALHDGQRYAIEKMAISIVTGMSMTNTTAPMRRTPVTLLAGVALPGPVVEKMMHLSATPASDNLSARSGFARNIQTRAWRTRAETTVSELAADGRQRALEAFRASLALPGVKVEIAALSNILQGKTLLDAGFTVDQFQHALQSNDYRIVHIASHGVFGDSAEASFIMAYDDVLTLNSLELLLRSEKFQSHPIELLGLSACQTAEGNDRAPLGISGAAIKARARSVLGTLWPIADDAAQSVMTTFYTEITQRGQTKTEALRQAQLVLLRQPELSHPFYWAPFVLIGNWL
jgi:CHAT domain-containing protein